MIEVQEAVRHFARLYDIGALTDEEKPHIEALQEVFLTADVEPDFEWEKYSAKFKESGITSDVALEMVEYWRNRALRLEWEVEKLDQRMKTDQTFQVVTEAGHDWIMFYNIPCGPWHRILALTRLG